MTEPVLQYDREHWQSLSEQFDAVLATVGFRRERREDAAAAALDASYEGSDLVRICDAYVNATDDMILEIIGYSVLSGGRDRLGLAGFYAGCVESWIDGPAGARPVMTVGRSAAAPANMSTGARLAWWLTNKIGRPIVVQGPEQVPRLVRAHRARVAAVNGAVLSLGPDPLAQRDRWRRQRGMQADR